jgi:hypothetical protein
MALLFVTNSGRRRLPRRIIGLPRHIVDVDTMAVSLYLNLERRPTVARPL